MRTITYNNAGNYEGFHSLTEAKIRNRKVICTYIKGKRRIVFYVLATKKAGARKVTISIKINENVKELLKAYFSRTLLESNAEKHNAFLDENTNKTKKILLTPYKNLLSPLIRNIEVALESASELGDILRDQIHKELENEKRS